MRERDTVLGRFGPATLGTTLARSSSTISLKVGISESSVRNMPCSFAYRSTRSMCSGSRPEPRRYSSVRASTGNSDAVAPNSGDMLESVARSGTDIELSPLPQNSTNLLTTPCLRSISVSVSTRSVAVVPAGSALWNRTPTTTGASRNSGCPSMQASASMPPTPQPSTPMPLTIGVCESVPTSVSGKRHAHAVDLAHLHHLGEVLEVDLMHDAHPGRHHPEAAGMPAAPSGAASSARGCARTRGRCCVRTPRDCRRRPPAPSGRRPGRPGTSGSIRIGSPPARATAERIAARSTTAGTPVKSWSSTRAGMKARSRSVAEPVPSQRAIASTSPSRTEGAAALRTLFSSRIFSVTGSRETSPMPRSRKRGEAVVGNPRHQCPPWCRRDQCQPSPIHLRTRNRRPDHNTSAGAAILLVLTTAVFAGDLAVATTQRTDVRPEHQLYHEYSTEVDQARTNVHYEQPPEFFLLITGGDWNVYSANLWDPGHRDGHAVTGGQARPDRAARRSREGHAPHRCRLRLGGTAHLSLRDVRPHRDGPDALADPEGLRRRAGSLATASTRRSCSATGRTTRPRSRSTRSTPTR